MSGSGEGDLLVKEGSAKRLVSRLRSRAGASKIEYLLTVACLAAALIPVASQVSLGSAKAFDNAGSYIGGGTGTITPGGYRDGATCGSTSSTCSCTTTGSAQSAGPGLAQPNGGPAPVIQGGVRTGCRGPGTIDTYPGQGLGDSAGQDIEP